jgi:predicted metal-dependent phosphoesterase TrpH
MNLDLHNHTRWSFDGMMDPLKLVRLAKRRGIDAIAITDHDEIGGAREAEKAAAGDLLVIVGEEIGTRAGDILGLFLKERILEEDPLEAVRAVHAQGGLAILAHPFAMQTSVDEEVARALDGCEGFNARHSAVESVDGPEAEPRVSEFARRFDLSLTAGSDAHFYREVGRARTVVAAGSLEEAREQILRGNTVLSGRRSGRLGRWASAMLERAKGLWRPEPD